MIELRNVDIKDIIFGERFRDEYGDLDTLAASIKKEGIIQPLAVKMEGNKYVLLAGGRRYKACMQAGVSEIPVRCYPDTLSSLEMRSIELMENFARKDLTWVEAANLKKEIHELQISIHGKKTSTSPDAPGWAMKDTAELLGKSIGGVSDDIKMANAVEVFPQLKQAKTKNDAVKALKKLQEEMVIAELAKRIRDKQSNTPMERLHEGLINNYIIRDFFDGVKQVPNNSIDIVEIDPPYAIGLGDSTIKKTDDSMQTGTKNYNEVSADQYVAFLDNLLKETYRTMSENSWLIFWFAQEPWFEVVFQSIRRAGFSGNRIQGIWYKEGSTGQCNQPHRYMANLYEGFFYACKGDPSITRQGRGNVFPFKTVSSNKKVHPTERPIELIQDILYTFAWEGARLMVPFLGSGNTLLAASNIGITAFGFDLAEEYRNSYIINVTSSVPGQYKSYKGEA